MSDSTSDTSSNAPDLLSLDDIVRQSHVDAVWIAELVEYGVLEPHGRTETEWQFEAVTIVRIAKAKRLQRDLALNPPGIAMVLDLLDQIDALRAQLRTRTMG